MTGDAGRDWRAYAGRWVALVGSAVAGTGLTAVEARRAAKSSRCREEPRLAFVSRDGILLDSGALPSGSGILHDEVTPYTGARNPQPGHAPDLLSMLTPVARQALDIVRDLQPRAHLVGGVVRDWLLGRATHDLDVTVPGGAIELARSIADALRGRFFAMDEKRDIGRAIIPDVSGLLVVDVSAWRGESLEADLLGRDFTINAMALPINGLEIGSLVDIANGLEDLGLCRVRATSDATFSEDSARLVRAVRLAGELGFTVEEATREMAQRDGGLVASVAGERVHEEMCRILALPHVGPSIRLLEALGLLGVMLPELDPLRGMTQGTPHHFDGFEHSLRSIEALDRLLALMRGDKSETGLIRGWGECLTSLIPLGGRVGAYLAETASPGESRLALLRFATLLHDAGKPGTRHEEGNRVRFTDHPALGARIAAGPLERLRFSRSGAAVVTTLIERHMWLLSLARAADVSRRAAYRYFRALGDSGLAGALLFLADWMGTGDAPHPGWPQAASVATRIVRTWFEQAEVVAPVALLSGSEIMEALKLRPGPVIGSMLEAIREAQAAGAVTTRDQALDLAERIARSEKA